MSDEPIFREVLTDLERGAHDIASRISHDLTHHAYHETDPVGSPTKGTAVSLSAVASEVRSGLGSLLTNAQNDYNAVKDFLDNKLPEVERVGQLIDSDPLAQIALGDLVPQPLRQIAADAVSAVVKAFQAAPAPAADVTASDGVTADASEAAPAA